MGRVVGFRHCYFARQAPDVEVRGERVLINTEGTPCEIAVSARTLGKFVANANRALDQWHECGRVIPIR
jgi:hypothetical protein